MNKKQWFVLGFIFLGIMMFLMYLDFGNSAIYAGYSTELSAFEIHIAVFDAFMDMSIIFSFLISIIFWIMGWLENE